MGLVNKIKQLTLLSTEATEWLEAHIEHFEYRKNEIVLRSGRLCNYLYSVKTGIMCGYYAKEQNEVCNWIAIENDLATSYYSYISRQASYETIECLEAVTAEALSYEHTSTMYTLYPETERAGRLLLEDYYMRLEERLQGIQFRTAKERYEHLLLKRPEIVQRAPLGKVASYLGMKQETLSRIRAGK